MVDSRQDIKKLLHDLSDENYAEAYKTLGKVMLDKTKKRCSAEYDKLKNSSGNK